MAGGRATRSLKILAVDDDAIIREGLEETIHELGYDCSTASDGFEALGMHQEKPFDIVLSIG
jgi:CheY-like chemotaxis protein